MVRIDTPRTNKDVSVKLTQDRRWQRRPTTAGTANADLKIESLVHSTINREQERGGIGRSKVLPCLMENAEKY